MLLIYLVYYVDVCLKLDKVSQGTLINPDKYLNQESLGNNLLTLIQSCRLLEKQALMAQKRHFKVKGLKNKPALT